MRFPILPILLIASCSIPDPTTVPLTCTDTDPCPPGRFCTSGVCSQPPSSDGPLADMSANTDDLPPAYDLSNSADLAEVIGCKSAVGAVRLADKVYKCPGVFSATNKASGLCAAGYSVCGTLPAAAATLCNTQPGFFASSLIGSRRDIDPPGASVCSQAELLRTVYGCGAGGLVAATTCSSFTRLIDCDRNVGTWACASTLDASSQNLATNGVLCCAP